MYGSRARRRKPGEASGPAMRRYRLSLKGMLLCLLLPGMLGSLALDRYNDYHTLRDMARAVYDGALRVPMGVLGRSVHLEANGQLDVDTAAIAYKVIGSSETPVRYQIQRLGADPLADPTTALAAAKALIGDAELPLPPDWREAAAPGMAFFDAMVEGEPMRVAAQVRPVVTPRGPAFVLIQAAQSNAERTNAESSAWRQETWRDVRVLLVMALLLWLGVSWGLRPLVRLRAEVAARAPDDATPLDASAVPGEVAPLVEAVNHHIRRQQAMVDEQTQFLADASHQLRTPLTVMLTQAEYALRESDPQRMRESVRALIARLDKTRRLTTQLLSLALARHTPQAGPAAFDLAACGRDVLIEYLPMADQRGIDLGWEGDEDGAAWVRGHADGIREAVANLLHNALEYTPRGGQISLACGEAGGFGWLRVTDNGPGIPAERREEAFDRFARLAPAPEGGGAGLGLAIARAFVQRDNGDITLGDGDSDAQGNVGLDATIRLPLSRVASQHAP
ncbi:sensor histidine kinase [Verticiella sediminum]|uniref:histidine kinase n=1 Tax=Verticiella sediminum TaxID=1247510 RepID=A0A556AMN2_9BURK|nr:sensor histidine kinase [Verticiella sediminum]TSH94131.1 sensor histidine kinase [Verticiella sediminum]